MPSYKLITSNSPELPAKTTKASYKEVIANLSHLHTEEIDSFSGSKFYDADFSTFPWLVMAAERFKKTPEQIAYDCIGHRNSFQFQKEKKFYQQSKKGQTNDKL